MTIRNWREGDEREALRLWNSAGARAGYAPQDMEGLQSLLLKHPDFMPEHTFVIEEGGGLIGFANGCTGAHITRGDERGYISCVLATDGKGYRGRAEALLSALEQSFREKGRRYAAVTFFNPIRLPWIIPGTQGCQHNNMPGVPDDLPLCGIMLDRGYQKAATEMAMYLDLADFTMPPSVLARQEAMAQSGYTVDWYREGEHKGLDDMVATLNNSMWSAEIPAAGHNGMRLLVGLYGDTVAGFTGPVYPEATGRGYFAGIGVAPAYEGHGLGTLLFYRLCEAEKGCGARYMSLFTGVENRAQEIYKGAGFTPRRYFAVMLKEL